MAPVRTQVLCISLLSAISTVQTHRTVFVVQPSAMRLSLEVTTKRASKSVAITGYSIVIAPGQPELQQFQLTFKRSTQLKSRPVMPRSEPRLYASRDAFVLRLPSFRTATCTPQWHERHLANRRPSSKTGSKYIICQVRVRSIKS